MEQSCMLVRVFPMIITSSAPFVIHHRYQTGRGISESHTWGLFQTLEISQSIIKTTLHYEFWLYTHIYCHEVVDMSSGLCTWPVHGSWRRLVPKERLFLFSPLSLYYYITPFLGVQSSYCYNLWNHCAGHKEPFHQARYLPCISNFVVVCMRSPPEVS